MQPTQAVAYQLVRRSLRGWSGTPADFGRLVSKVEAFAKGDLEQRLVKDGVTERSGYLYEGHVNDHTVKIEVTLKGNLRIESQSWEDIQAHAEYDSERIQLVLISYGRGLSSSRSGVLIALNRRWVDVRLEVRGDSLRSREIANELYEELVKRCPWWSIFRSSGWGQLLFSGMAISFWLSAVVPRALRAKSWDWITETWWAPLLATNLLYWVGFVWALPALEILPEGRHSSRGRWFALGIGAFTLGIIGNLIAAVVQSGTGSGS